VLPEHQARKALLGGKGANLAEMTRIGVPVPPGFTITTEACRHYLRRAPRTRPAARGGRDANLRRLEEATGKRFGGTPRPAAGLGALRRGGLDAGDDGHDPQPRAQRRTVEALARESGNERFAYDSYRRFVQMYGDVVLGVRGERFEHCSRR
jgi:pyruvate, orthophosphate dikinase